jgi:hypothetical protein
VLTTDRVVTAAATDPDGVKITVPQHTTGVEVRVRHGYLAETSR